MIVVGDSSILIALERIGQQELFHVPRSVTTRHSGVVLLHVAIHPTAIVTRRRA